MASTPWMTSNQIISAIQRKISMPIAQSLFSNDDILAFVNEEMMISQVPSILLVHEEYLVSNKLVPLLSNQNRYAIPDRAIGMKLRDLFWQDIYGNLFQMSQITEEDKAFFQRSIGANQAIHKYYVEGNDVVLSPTPQQDPTGFLMFVFFLRPNQLVTDDRAAFISGFSKTITLNNSFINPGDTVSVSIVTTPIPPGTPIVTMPTATTQTVTTIFTAVSGSPAANQFQIGVDSITTANNLVAAINSSGVVLASNGAPTDTNIVKLTYQLLSATGISVSNPQGFVLSATQGVEFQSVPSIITNSSTIDFLQTKPGHKIRAYDVLIPLTGVSGTTINFNSTDVPQDLVIGDYICLQNECIIPQIPPELHNGLAERAGARILASMGDAAGLAASNQKIAEIDSKQGTLLDSRVDGSPRKITAKYSLLRWGRIGTRRRF
jgi:hypothetical protein